MCSNNLFCSIINLSSDDWKPKNNSLSQTNQNQNQWIQETEFCFNAFETKSFIGLWSNFPSNSNLQDQNHKNNKTLDFSPTGKQGFQANLAFTTVHCIYLKLKSKSSKCFQLVGLSTFALKCEDLMVLGFPKRECTRGAAGQQKIKQPVPEESSQVWLSEIKPPQWPCKHLSNWAPGGVHGLMLFCCVLDLFISFHELLFSLSVSDSQFTLQIRDMKKFNLVRLDPMGWDSCGSFYTILW